MLVLLKLLFVSSAGSLTDDDYFDHTVAFNTFKFKKALELNDRMLTQKPFNIKKYNDKWLEFDVKQSNFLSVGMMSSVGLTYLTKEDPIITIPCNVGDDGIFNMFHGNPLFKLFLENDGSDYSNNEEMKENIKKFKEELIKNKTPEAILKPVLHCIENNYSQAKTKKYLKECNKDLNMFTLVEKMLQILRFTGDNIRTICYFYIADQRNKIICSPLIDLKIVDGKLSIEMIRNGSWSMKKPVYVAVGLGLGVVLIGVIVYFVIKAFKKKKLKSPSDN